MTDDANNNGRQLRAPTDGDRGRLLRAEAGLLRAHWTARVPDFCAAHGLSARECEVVRGVVNREQNTAIARRLGISTQTVRFHLKSIYRKLDAEDRVDLIMTIFEFCWQNKSHETYLER